MSSPFAMSIASKDDIEGMVQVLIKCEDLDPIKRLWYDKSLPQIKTELPRVVLSSDLEDLDRRVFKATLQETGKIVAFGSMRYQKGKIEDSLPTPGSAIAGTNTELATAYTGSIRAKYKEHLDGQKRIEMGLTILPEYQGEVIVSEMLQWAFIHFGLKNETVWTVLPRLGSDVFSRFGWMEVDVVDIDVGKWVKGEKQTFVYQMLCMIRRPGELRITSSMIEK